MLKYNSDPSCGFKAFILHTFRYCRAVVSCAGIVLTLLETTEVPRNLSRQYYPSGDDSVASPLGCQRGTSEVPE